jgi:NADP-reducing hydrogenase subunit HndB
MCDLIEPNGQKTTYWKLSPDMARRIGAEHVVNGHPVYEYTIGAAEKKAAE